MAGELPKGDPWPNSNTIEARPSWTPSTFHAYVHVPFCKARCGYCDFNTYLANELRGASQQTFHKALQLEINFAAEVLQRSKLEVRPLTSVFFGGGTPTLFSVDQIGSVLNALQASFAINPDAEVTVEANPDTVDEQYLDALVASGVNRISFGVQSFDPNVLATLDRTHRPEYVPEVVALAKSVGLRVSVDLIYGTPGESLQSWRDTLQRAIELDTEHISAYSLIVEPGTKLAAKVNRGELPNIDADFHADCYEMGSDLLESAGFRWYEVSNWAKGVQNESVHNRAYWQSRDWWGFGPGAHSHFAGTRWWNAKHPATYQDLLDRGVSPAVGQERLTERQVLEERLLLELRTAAGIEAEVLSQLEIDKGVVASEIANGNLALLPDRRLSVTRQGRLIADGIVLRLLGSQ